MTPPDPALEESESHYHDKHVSRNFPPPKAFIDATCAEICQEECVPKTVGEEFHEFAGVVGQKLHGLVPDVFESGAAAVKDYVADVGRALAGQTALLSTKSKSSQKSLSCRTQCETLVEKCSDILDSSDSVPEKREDVTIDPARSRCADTVKLKFIAEQGSIKYSSKFGVPPTFQQLASLAEPLLGLAFCADGGNDATLNLKGALGLLNCMVDASNAYADQIAHALSPTKAGARGTEAGNGGDLSRSGERGDPGDLSKVSADAMHSAPLPRTSGPSLREELFFVNDVRCFASRCGPVYEEKIVKHCEKDGVCGSDFGHILFQTGVLHTEANLMKAAKQMLKQHVDEHDERVEQVREEIAAGRRGAEEKAVVMPGDHKTHRTEPSFVEKQKTQDPAHEKAIKEAALSFDPPPFCRAQMCAPYPLSTLTGRGLGKFLASHPDEQCGEMEKIADGHPHDLYEGILDEPEGSISDSEDTALWYSILHVVSGGGASEEAAGAEAEADGEEVDTEDHAAGADLDLELDAEDDQEEAPSDLGEEPVEDSFPNRMASAFALTPEKDIMLRSDELLDGEMAPVEDAVGRDEQDGRGAGQAEAEDSATSAEKEENDYHGEDGEVWARGGGGPLLQRKRAAGAVPGTETFFANY
eukprot:g5088.t1